MIGCLPLLLFLTTLPRLQPSTTMSNVASPIPDFNDHYTGAIVDGNYVWSGAMNLCWTELCKNVLKGPLALNTLDQDALAMADHFNHPVIAREDLDDSAYYVKSGFGPKTLEVINRESRSKFPKKSFGDIEADLGEEDIISYAYFFKNVRYEKPFTRKTVMFDTIRVNGFEAKDEEKNTVEVLKYENNDRFVVRLRLKESNDELILAKGYAMDQPADVLREIDGLPAGTSSRMSQDDQFQMPLLGLTIRRDYNEMIGQPLSNEGFRQHQIGLMFENIAFELDETGAKVESQAVITVERSAFRPGKLVRYFYLDKPFWVIMKQKNSTHPYFLLGVNRANILQPL